MDEEQRKAKERERGRKRRADAGEEGRLKRNEAARRSRARNIEKYRARDREAKRVHLLEHRKEINRRVRERRKALSPEQRKEINYKTMFGLTFEQVEVMSKAQDGKCALCGEAPKGKTEHTKRLLVDHCHSNKAVRGLLCHRCNLGLGKFKENVEVMERAASYLEHHERLHKEGKARIISNTQLG